MPILLATLLIILSLMMTACAANNYAPIRDLERPRAITWGSYNVRKGDTLYGIAWRFGRDYHELAAANGISWPYTIYQGQRINLAKKPPPKTERRVVTAPTKTSQEKPVARVTKTAVSPQRPLQNTPLIWHWPIQGPIANHFSDTNKGIDIKARAGTPVKAPADGVVVYAGSGLIGYGNLVIIKHSETYLSAYAHNKKIVVIEQTKVKAGEKIAEIGTDSDSLSKLHFEIRKNGQPVNPLWYLPKTGG